MIMQLCTTSQHVSSITTHEVQGDRQAECSDGMQKEKRLDLISIVEGGRAAATLETVGGKNGSNFTYSHATGQLLAKGGMNH